MISHEHWCIFIHIPKCGGSSIEVALRQLGPKGRGTQDHRTIRHFEAPGIASFATVGNMLVLARRLILRSGREKQDGQIVDTRQFRTYIKFAAVRDPWSRAYSAYSNLVRDPRHLARLGIGADIGFGPFLRRFVGRGMLRPQTYWIQNNSGTDRTRLCLPLRSAGGGVPVGVRARRMPAVPLPHMKPGRTKDWARHYTPGLVDLVASAYREEIDQFGFKFEQASPAEAEPWKRVA